jgi:hypothetical protein
MPGNCDVAAFRVEGGDAESVAHTLSPRGDGTLASQAAARRPSVVRDLSQSVQKGEAGQEIGEGPPIFRRTLRARLSHARGARACLRHWPRQPLSQRSRQYALPGGSNGIVIQNRTNADFQRASMRSSRDAPRGQGRSRNCGNDRDTTSIYPTLNANMRRPKRRPRKDKHLTMAIRERPGTLPMRPAAPKREQMIKNENR